MNQDQDPKDQQANGRLPNLEDFAEDLLKAKGVVNLDPEIIRQMKKDIIERLEKLTNHVIADSVPEEDIPAFEKLLDNNAPAEDLQKFVAEKVPDLADKLGVAYARFRDMYLG